MVSRRLYLSHREGLRHVMNSIQFTFTVYKIDLLDHFLDVSTFKRLAFNNPRILLPGTHDLSLLVNNPLEICQVLPAVDLYAPGLTVIVTAVDEASWLLECSGQACCTIVIFDARLAN